MLDREALEQLASTDPAAREQLRRLDFRHGLLDYSCDREWLRESRWEAFFEDEGWPTPPDEGWRKDGYPDLHEMPGGWAFPGLAIHLSAQQAVASFDLENF
jgi:hypothetical protein